jgi:hypothetical protein
MTERPDDESEREPADDAGDLWSAAFDPAANLRVLGEIQRRGLRAAGEIVERLIANVDGPPATGDQRGAATREAPSATDLGAGVDLWVEMAKRSLDVVARLATVASHGRSRSASPATTAAVNVNVDVEGVGAQETIELRARRTGPGDTTEVWLHNGTQAARDDLRLHCGELRSADGGVLPAGLAFDPEVIGELPARSSRGVTVGVAPWEGSAEPGTYRGIVMVTGLADVWLPVSVVVSP